MLKINFATIMYMYTIPMSLYKIYICVGGLLQRVFQSSPFTTHVYPHSTLALAILKDVS